MGTKSLFALDNLWDGLGALIHSNKNARYFVGKVTIYKEYPTVARELIYEYMFRYFPDADQLITPKLPIVVSSKTKKAAQKLFTGKDASSDYKALQKAVRNEGDSIPPLFNAYIGLSDTMRMFGSMIDHDFSSTFETGIMVTMADLLETKKKRYIEPYIEYLKIVIEERKKAKKLAKEQREARSLERKKKKEEKKATKKRDK